MIILCDDRDVILAIAENAVYDSRINAYQIAPQWSVMAPNCYAINKVPEEVEPYKYCFDGEYFTPNPSYEELVEFVPEPTFVSKLLSGAIDSI